MSTIEPDNSGIISLGGFSFQIRAFIYYVLGSKEDETIEFELCDDVSVTQNKLDLDDENFNFLSTIKNHAIQVKKTEITKKSVEKILKNWLIIIGNKSTTNRYTLFTNDMDVDNDIFHTIDVKKMFQSFNEVQPPKRSNNQKLKQLYLNDFLKFSENVNKIIKNHEIKKISNIDELIDNQSKDLFHKHGVKEYIYRMRVDRLIEYLNYEIMTSVLNKEGYKISHKEFKQLVVRVCDEINDGEIEIAYPEFKKKTSIDLKTKTIQESREYKQLTHCELSDVRLKNHLIHSYYYGQYRKLNLESNKPSIIEDIEITTRENYDEVVDNLIFLNKDTPRERLTKTVAAKNENTNKAEIRKGACIYLTRTNAEDNKISWKDD